MCCRPFLPHLPSDLLTTPEIDHYSKIVLRRYCISIIIMLDMILLRSK